MTHDAKLGQIIDNPDASRDAIHIALAPVTAAERLSPGQHVGLTAGGEAADALRTHSPAIGIVDPFLPGLVAKGERFWLFLYQNTITSLRHAWTHPAFEGEGVGTESPISPAGAISSQQWIENFAKDLDQTYGRLMAAAENFVEYGDYTRDDQEKYKGHWDRFPEFWQHWAAVTGKEPPEDRTDVPFTCSC